MRIILFHQYFLGQHDPGGSRWNELTNFFNQKADFSIEILAGNIHYATGKKVLPNTWLNTEVIHENIILHRTWTYSGYNSNFFGRLIGYLSYTMSSLVKAICMKKPDIYIVTSPSLFVGISALCVAKLKKVPFIFEVRDLWPESAIATGVLKNKFLLNILYWLEFKLYKESKKIVVLTPAFRENIAKRFPEFQNKIEVICNGADFSIARQGHQTDEIRKKLGWKGKKVFAYFGAHGIANDLIQVIDVAKAMEASSNVLFVLIGDGMQKEFLKERANKYQLSNVVFIDSVPKYEVFDYIQASDVCMAILKKTDTFKTVYPNKVFDYMSCRKPILVTIDGITKELVETAQCGFYSEPENLDAFKLTVERFIHLSKDKMNVLGENGYQYVKQYFDREKLAEQYIKLIKETVYG